MKGIKKKFFFIYATKVLGILTGLLSVMMVVPKLTSNPAIYGVYTICISLGMFFSYADLGFLSAGQKYAAESYAQNNRKEETGVIAFVLFILAVFVALIMIVLSVLAYSPGIIIKSGSMYDFAISSKLIITLALFSPVIVIQKFNLLVCSIRIEEYIYQLIELGFNVLKIAAVSLFVTPNDYNITGYFLTIQILSLVSAMTCTLVIKKKYSYKLTEVFKQFRFSKVMYERTKGLAISSLVLTFAWILYFELDTIILSKFYGIEVVAMYGVAFVILNFCRNIYNTLFGPYQSYFYHFTGQNDHEGLYKAFTDLLRWTFPLMVIPPLILIAYMRPIIEIWVGDKFTSSILIARIFVLTIAFTSFYIPIGYLMIAKGLNRVLRFNAVILPFLFYGALFLFNYFGLEEKSLAASKLLTIGVNFCIYIVIAIRLFGITIIKLFIHLVRNIIAPMFLLFLLSYLMPVLSDLHHGDIESYLKLMGQMIFVLMGPLIMYYYIEPSTRLHMTTLWKRIYAHFRLS